ncbi:MAG: hypothetical protein FJ139_08640 [Deltaproteobacteria bacterium]|nr:hypothetical protein [Deltaproteobacteria bacterium]
MSFSSQGEKGPYWDIFAKMPRESFELMFGGIEIYNKMSKAWMENVELLARGKPEDALKFWTESSKDIFKGMTEMFAKTAKAFGISPLAAAPPWADFPDTLQGLMSAAPFGLPSSQQGIEEFIKFTRGWQDSYIRMSDAWINYLEKNAEFYKTGMEKGAAPEKIWRDCMESTEGLLKAWVNFVTEQTRAYFELWKSLLPKEKAPAKRAAAKPKESK